MGVSTRGLFGFLSRLRPAPAADSDAELLGRFVRSSDEAAFTELVRRHGPMVLSVCRRRLGRDADAEDAFQAVFLALAQSAHSIGRRESLPGWLYRVAYLVALKAAGRRARRPAPAPLATEVPMPDSHPPAWETDELRAVIDAEVASLPDKFRAVIVLCLVEGRTNTEAASVLGVPVGTVDSRLSTARQKLQDRLRRRGVAVGAGVTLEQLLGGSADAAGPRVAELLSLTASAVLAEVAQPGIGAVSPTVSDLARGVATMTTKLRLLAALAIVLGLAGGTGTGIYFATAADPANPIAKADVKAATEAPPAAAPDAPPAKTEAKPDVPAKDAPVKGAAALQKPFGQVVAEGTKLEDILGKIEEQTDLVLRVDMAAFQRVGATGPNGDVLEPAQFLKSIYDTQIVLPRKADKIPTSDILADALAQVRLSHPCTYQVRGTQLVIVPAYVPLARPGVNPLDPNDDDAVLLSPAMTEQIYGGVVSLTADKKPLTDILAELRKQTGANIVLDPRCEGQEKKASLSVALSDVRLYDALRVIADMAELKLVYAGNIYYVTTAANAKSFQPPAPRTAPAPVAPLPNPLGGK